MKLRMPRWNYFFLLRKIRGESIVLVRLSLSGKVLRFSAGSLKADRFLEGQNWFLSKEMGQTNEQQHHFNKFTISELHWEVDSIQTILKLLYTHEQ